MTSHRTKDRKKLFPSGVLEEMSGPSVTIQNNSLGQITVCFIADLRAGQVPGEEVEAPFAPRYWIAKEQVSILDDRVMHTH